MTVPFDPVLSPEGEYRRWVLYYLSPAVIIFGFIAAHVTDIASYPDSLWSSITLAGVAVLVLVALTHYAEVYRYRRLK